MDKSYRDLSPGAADLVVGLVNVADTVPVQNKKVYKQVSRSGSVIDQDALNMKSKSSEIAKTQASLPDLKKPAVPPPFSQVKNASAKDVDQDLVLKLDLDSGSLLNGLILSEVLGKPKCMRRGRWY